MASASYLRTSRVAEKNNFLLANAAQVADQGGNILNVILKAGESKTSEGTSHANFEDGISCAGGLKVDGERAHKGHSVRSVT